jgi:hypothetical protein
MSNKKSAPAKEELAILGPLGIDTFHSGLALPFGNFFAPIVIELNSDEYPTINGTANYQSLSDCLEYRDEPSKMTRVIKRTLSEFMSTAGPAGVGQHSLIPELGSAAILARFDIRFRDATQGEMLADLDYWGEQVMGPEVGKEESNKEKETFKDNPKMKALGSEFYYTGMPRLVNFVFQTRFVRGFHPTRENLERIAGEIGRHAIKKEGLIPQGYQFILGENGWLHYSPFDSDKDGKLKIEQYKSNPYGSVSLTNGKLFYFPPNGSPKDFSRMIFRGK